MWTLYLIGQANFSGNPLDAAWTTDFQSNNARVENGNLVLKMQKGNSVNKFGNKPGFGATVSSTRWMLYGTVSVRIKSGSWGGGIISSFIFRSALTGDEKYPSTPSQIQFSIWDRELSDPETRDWAGGPAAWEEGQPPYEMMIDWVHIKCHTPIDPVLDAWPPKDQGFQGYVNPLSKDLASPLAKDAIV
ncbi:hypothetical protein BGW39_007005 [Mortierella sp. 14UC]|nr:hypothetical protein BGW39_007005 [Mortierella sp. 14UC]